MSPLRPKSCDRKDVPPVDAYPVMMQKMGEILGKYADKIKDEKGSAP